MAVYDRVRPCRSDPGTRRAALCECVAPMCERQVKICLTDQLKAFGLTEVMREHLKENRFLKLFAALEGLRRPRWLLERSMAYMAESFRNEQHRNRNVLKFFMLCADILGLDLFRGNSPQLDESSIALEFVRNPNSEMRLRTFKEAYEACRSAGLTDDYRVQILLHPFYMLNERCTVVITVRQFKERYWQIEF